MPELRRVPADAPLDDVLPLLTADGAVVVEDFVTTDVLGELWDDLGPGLVAETFGADATSGTRTRRLSSLFARTRRLTPVVTHPLFLGAARRILQQPSTIWMGRERVEVTPNIQIGVTQAIQIHPGQGRQPLHRDDALHLRRHPGPDSRVQVMLAMSDFTAANGGTLVIPGSNHWDDDRAPRHAECVPTTMRAGSALIFVGSVYHGGGSNQSDEPRTGLTIGLDLANLRQEENQYLAVPPEAVLAYPEEVRRLLGYDACPPDLGWLEMRNPYTVLETAAAQRQGR
jgi:ectoine hydroxylase-related dioxygenase (phytanoyl-CoA dioxygenase family)